MTIAGLTRRSIRDIAGNLVPLSILIFFAVWFAIDAPWGWDSLTIVFFYGLVGGLFAVLFAGTYLLARRIQAIEGAEGADR